MMIVNEHRNGRRRRVTLRRIGVDDSALDAVGERLTTVDHPVASGVARVAPEPVDLRVEPPRDGASAVETWIAYDGEEPVGVVRLRDHAGSTTEVQLLRVDALWLLTGLGAALARFAMERGRAWGRGRVMIGPDPGLSALRSLAWENGWPCLLPSDGAGAEALRRRRLLTGGQSASGTPGPREAVPRDGRSRRRSLRFD